MVPCRCLRKYLWNECWVSKRMRMCAKSLLTPCDPKNCSPSSSSVHGILQARILQWASMHPSKGSSQPRIEHTSLSPALAGGFFATSANGWEAISYWEAPVRKRTGEFLSSDASCSQGMHAGRGQRETGCSLKAQVKSFPDFDNLHLCLYYLRNSTWRL